MTTTISTPPLPLPPLSAPPPPPITTTTATASSSSTTTTTPTTATHPTTTTNPSTTPLKPLPQQPPQPETATPDPIDPNYTTSQARTAFTTHLSHLASTHLQPLQQRAADIAANDAVIQEQNRVLNASLTSPPSDPTSSSPSGTGFWGNGIGFLKGKGKGNGGKGKGVEEGLVKEAEGAQGVLKGLGDVQNWAEVLEREMSVIEMTLAQAEGEDLGDGWETDSEDGDAVEDEVDGEGEDENDGMGDERDDDAERASEIRRDKGKGKEKMRIEGKMDAGALIAENGKGKGKEKGKGSVAES